jgi:hypothetical protein
VRLAVLVGNPAEPGPYVIRVKAPGGTKLMPHQHPEDRIYTVMSGVFYIGLGARFDGDQVKAYPPGSVIVLPGNTAHFHWAKSGEYITQVTAIGPLWPYGHASGSGQRRSACFHQVVTGWGMQRSLGRHAPHFARRVQSFSDAPSASRR